MTNKLLIRDLKIGISTGEYKAELDLKELPSSWYFLIKKRRIINYLFDNGAVLTGSRALKCYRINGKKLFNRRPSDWDFLITREQFIKLCEEYKIYDFNLEENKYYLDKSFAVFKDRWSVSIWFPCFIQLILVDELTNFIEKDNKRFSTLSNIIDNKIDLVENANDSLSSKKHQKDLNNILVNSYFI